MCQEPIRKQIAQIRIIHIGFSNIHMGFSKGTVLKGEDRVGAELLRAERVCTLGMQMQAGVVIGTCKERHLERSYDFQLSSHREQSQGIHTPVSLSSFPQISYQNTSTPNRESKDGGICLYSPL